MRARALVVLLIAVALGAVGCAPRMAEVKVPEVALPASFAGGALGAAGASAALIDWRGYLGDAKLIALVDEALAHNFDLQIALQRIEAARAAVRGAGGALGPQVMASAGASATRWGAHTGDSGAPWGELSVGLEAAWEPDLWGRLRGLRGAARAQYLAKIEGRNLVVSSLVAELAASYFELLALDATRDSLAATIARQAQALQMIRAQKEAGRANELAVQQFEAQLAGTRAKDAEALQQSRALEHAMNVLLGRLPQTNTRDITRDRSQLEREVAPAMATGVPSELLRNRPDLREAELQVAATRFDLAAARAAFYPSLSITAGAGYRASSPRHWFVTPDSLVGSLAAGLLAPLVNRRELEAQLAIAQATQVEAMLRYQRVILVSFAEVATGLSALEQGAARVALQRHKLAAVIGMVDAADALFLAGKASYLEVLLAQESSLESELELIAAQRDHHLASLGLYKALGGGWR